MIMFKRQTLVSIMVIVGFTLFLNSLFLKGIPLAVSSDDWLLGPFLQRSLTPSLPFVKSVQHMKQQILALFIETINHKLQKTNCQKIGLDVTYIAHS